MFRESERTECDRIVRAMCYQNNVSYLEKREHPPFVEIS
jgi:hypothetical protein